LVQEPVMPDTIRFHRVLAASSEQVYRAFLDADAKVKWLPPNGFTGKVHHLRSGRRHLPDRSRIGTGKSQPSAGRISNWADIATDHDSSL
jgi:hypothetical protein